MTEKEIKLKLLEIIVENKYVQFESIEDIFLVLGEEIPEKTDSISRTEMYNLIVDSHIKLVNSFYNKLFK